DRWPGERRGRDVATARCQHRRPTLRHQRVVSLRLRSLGGRCRRGNARRHCQVVPRRRRQRPRAAHRHRQTSRVHRASWEYAMISRRPILTALGLGAGSLFLPSLRGRGLVHAGPTEPPKRLILISTGHGTVRTNWTMRPAGLVGAEIADWEFPLTTPGLEYS